jgi:hypothetical protein
MPMVSNKLQKHLEALGSQGNRLSAARQGVSVRAKQVLTKTVVRKGLAFHNGPFSTKLEEI